MKGMTPLLQHDSITAMLVVAMVINTVDNHKVHAARSFGKRRRKLTVELGDVGEMDRVSGKRPELSLFILLYCFRYCFLDGENCAVHIF